MSWRSKPLPTRTGNVIMNTYPDCYPCLVRHAAEAVKLATDQTDRQKIVLKKILQMIGGEPLAVTPVRLTAKIHEIIQAELGVEDPYRTHKVKSNTLALAYLPDLYQFLDSSADRLKVATGIAIAGNIIDFGAMGEDFDLEKSIKNCWNSEFDSNDFARFREDLLTAKRIVYVGDNAGEIAFDRLLIEEIKQLADPEIIFVVRGKPILNDITLEDARAVGLTDIVKVVSSGGDGPGCELNRGSSETIRYFETADVIISKGQGNYETLSHEPYNIYFLLKIKCFAIAEDIGATKGDSVIKSSRAGHAAY